jgi:hypothetical protein
VIIGFYRTDVAIYSIVRAAMRGMICPIIEVSKYSSAFNMKWVLR